MKTRLLIIVGIGMLVFGFTIYGVWNFTDSQKETFQYSADYDDLLVRNVDMAVYKTVENHPNQNCFKLSPKEIEKFPNDFLDNMKSAADEEFNDSQIYPPGVYTGYEMTAKKEDSLNLLKTYQFNETKTVFSENIASIVDPQYHFDCFFEYEDRQYMLRLTFQNQIFDGNFVNVNFTKNSGYPQIKNQNITVFDGGFNSTVLFHNNLDENVILYSDDPIINSIDIDDGDIHENRFVKTIRESETVIPPGKFFSYRFSSHADKYDAPITYLVKPFNLEGSVTVKPYPRCMTVNDVKSLYEEVKVYPKFPSYLTKDYSFECGVHNTNAFVHFVYFTDDLRLQYSDRVNSAFDRNFFANGGLVIDYYDEAWNGWNEDPNYDKFEKAQENAQHPKSTKLNIVNEPAVMIKEYFWENGEQQSFNRLEVFLDEEQIRIKSDLPEEELIKIAESMVGQNSN